MDKRKNMKRERVKGLHWWDGASFLPLLFSQLWLYVQSVYIPFKVLKLCLKFHGDLGSFSSWGLRHILLNDGNDPKVTQNPVWWIIKWEKLKSNETSSPMQFPKSLSQPFPVCHHRTTVQPPTYLLWSMHCLCLQCCWKSSILSLGHSAHMKYIKKKFPVNTILHHTHKGKYKKCHVSEINIDILWLEGPQMLKLQLEKRKGKKWNAAMGILF